MSARHSENGAKRCSMASRACRRARITRFFRSSDILMKSAPPIHQKFSVRRAEIVKKYLTGESISPNRIYAGTKGGSRPVTKPSECRVRRGKTPIACRRPNRCVGVEVTAAGYGDFTAISIPQFETGYR